MSSNYQYAFIAYRPGCDEQIWFTGTKPVTMRKDADSRNAKATGPTRFKVERFYPPAPLPAPAKAPVLGARDAGRARYRRPSSMRTAP